MKLWYRRWLQWLTWFWTIWFRWLLWPWRWWFAKLRSGPKPDWPEHERPVTGTSADPDNALDTGGTSLPVWVKPKTRQRHPEAFVTRTFRHPVGQRDYKLYGAVAGAKTAVPLVVMLHGCKQSPDDFALGTRMNLHAAERGCLVLYPAQSWVANGYACWNWFGARDQGRDEGETALLAGMVREVMAMHPVDPEKVVVMGMSAGAAMSVNLVCAYPELFRGLGVHSGMPYGAAQSASAALKAMKQGASVLRPWPTASQDVPVVVFHGDSDDVVDPVNARQLLVQLTQPAVEGTTALAAETIPVKPLVSVTVPAGQGRGHTREVYLGANGQTQHAFWWVHGAGHAWSGGDPEGSYTDGQGPDATHEMLMFLLGPVERR